MVGHVAKVFGSVNEELLCPCATGNFRMMKPVPGEIVNVSGRCHTKFPGSSNWAPLLPTIRFQPLVSCVPLHSQQWVASVSSSLP